MSGTAGFHDARGGEGIAHVCEDGAEGRVISRSGWEADANDDDDTHQCECDFVSVHDRYMGMKDACERVPFRGVGRE